MANSVRIRFGRFLNSGREKSGLKVIKNINEQFMKIRSKRMNIFVKHNSNLNCVLIHKRLDQGE